MARVIQVELTTPAKEVGHSTRLVTWVEAALKPVAGMVLTSKGDKRPWTVAWAGTLAQEMDGVNSWKAGV